jgi:two-component system phosphate regulon sensor histidine kinase PhoR
LSYELDSYLDARKDFPKLNGPLQALDADYFHVKSDILARTMSFSTQPGSMAGLVTLSVGRVKEIARLKENEKYRKEFVGNVSHEIKTPIFNIQGYISTLLDGGVDDPVLFRRYLERTEKSIDRLINITKDLEAISKLESGVLNLNYERFDIVALTRDIVDSVEFEATKKNITIVIGSSYTVPYPSVWVKADRYYIEQVLINLIINSIRYGNEGGETFIKYIDLFDKVLVEVRDNGRGIAKEDIPRVFERFYRTDKGRSREQGGTGLGLSIVRDTVRLYGGTIAVAPNEPAGTTFTVLLPVWTEEEGTA